MGSVSPPDLEEGPCGPVGVLDSAAKASRLVADASSADAVFPLVYRMMHALAGPSRDLDDLVQTANEQVLRSLPSFEGRARFSTWVYRVCYLTMLKENRWHRRWLRRFTLTDDGELPERADDETSADVVLRREREIRVRAARAD